MPKVSDAYKTRGMSQRTHQIRRSFKEFLGLPTLVIAAFLLLAILIIMLEVAHIPALATLQQWLSRYVFKSPEATSNLLRVLTGSIITVTSITFSVLPLAVQQAAGLFTSQVIQQFLDRKLNQVYFGFFVGLSLYLLLLLAAIGGGFNPVLGAMLGVLFAIVALYFLVMLVYTTINQVQPSLITESIHNHTMKARERQIDLVSRTRRSSRLRGGEARVVKSHQDGFVTEIRLGTLSSAANRSGVQ